MDSTYQAKISGIGLFIKNLRLSEGLSQTEFSEFAGIHPNSLSNLENGRNFTILTMIKCIEATGLSLEEFFEEFD